MLIFSLIFIIACGNNKSPSPKNNLDNEQLMNDSTNTYINKNFFELEESIDDIQRQIAQLHTRVMEYEYQSVETDYTKKLRELINNTPLEHEITLKNGSIIKCTIEKDLQNHLLVNTDLGKLTISKNEIQNVEDLELPFPDIIFVGHGKEELVDSIHIFSGKIMNQGNRRADFVRVLYFLWDEETNLITSDSIFVDGRKTMYKSGIITDSVIEPNQSINYTLKIKNVQEIAVSYVTRDIHWTIYD